MPLTISHEATHAQLSNTVDDLAQWLSVVEIGLTSLLETANEDIIEEEQENEVLSSGVNGENGHAGDEHAGFVNGQGGAGAGGINRTGVGVEYVGLEKDKASVMVH